MQAKLSKYLNMVDIAKAKFKAEQDTKKTAAIKAGKDVCEFQYMERIDIAEFWRELSDNPDFSTLSALARRLLSIPASSAAVERLFSATGFIMRPHRNRLEDRLVQQVFFLRGNKHILMEALKKNTKQY
jgi:hypothetical protein